MKELTNTEEQIMQILWKLRRGFVKDVIEELPPPKPPYSTISSVIRILEKKEFVGHKQYGTTYEYFPIVSKEAYKEIFLKSIVANYFNNSYSQLVSFFAREEKIDIKELERLIKEIKNQKK